MSTRRSWAIDFLNALGNTLPDERTVRFVSSWTKGEGTRAKYNPLATTQGYTGASNFNSVGVKDYASRADGIAASVLTVKSNFHGYAELAAGLATNNPELAFSGGGLDTWGTGTAAVSAIYLLPDPGDEMLASEPDNEPSAPPSNLGGIIPSLAPQKTGDTNTIPSGTPTVRQTINTQLFTESMLSSFFKQSLGWTLIGAGVIILIVLAVSSDTAKQSIKTGTNIAKTAAIVAG